MKRSVYTLLSMLMVLLLLLTSCNDYETYGDKKEKERNAIVAYIRNNNISVITESQFEQQDSTTDVGNNEYVYLDKSGIYLQIVRKGCGTKLEENKTVNVLFRFSEYNMLADTMQLRNDNSARFIDVMSVKRTSASISGTFVKGLMLSTYGTSAVPNAFLLALRYVNIGRPLDDKDEICKLNMIVPHSQGQAHAQQNVYPCFYTITLERER